MIIPPLIRKYRWQLAAMLLVSIVLLALAVRWWRGPQFAAETVVRRDFVQSVVASGHIETPHRVEVGAQMTGTVVRVPVIEGQNVKVGELLVEFESAELRAMQRVAEGSVIQAQARQRQLREVQVPVAEQALRHGQANLDTARSTQQRNQDLFQKGFISAAALDQFRNAAELADAQVRTAQKQLDTARPTGSDSALADAAVTAARAGTDAARAKASYAAIHAPVAGTLIGRSVEVGDVVQPGKVLMTLSPAGNAQVVVAIDEKNLRLLALGQNALVSADAYSQQRFTAVLAYINPGVNALTGAIEVKLDVPEPPLVLKQDMTVSVDIEVARRPGALLVATSAVHEVDGAAPWVMVVEENTAVRRPVRLGLRSGGFAEVIEGLREGDRVLFASAAITAGARVRTTPAAP